MSKVVLVTGANGFVGRHVLPLLVARGFTVHAVTSQAHPEAAATVPAAHWQVADLLDPQQVGDLVQRTRPSHLLHLAWYAIPGQYWTAPANFQWVQASLELMHQFQAQGGQRVVMAGTCAEYDWRYGYCHEDITPTQPSSPYGICKDALRRLLLAYAQHQSMSSAWGRIFFLYGNHEPPSRLVPAVIRSLLQNEPARCSHGRQIRDFLHVTDGAAAFVALLESDVQGAVNIASGQPLPLRDIIYGIAEQLQSTHRVELGAVPAGANDVPLLVADVLRLTQEVGWQPQVSLADGLASTIAWWQTQLGEWPMPQDSCPLCQGSHLTNFLHRERVPVHQNLPCSSPEDARSIPMGRLQLAICQDCGFVFNRAFEPGLLRYGSNYDNNQNHSAAFGQHIDSLVQKLVLEQQIRDCTVVEVGCGQGDFLRRLVAPAALGNRGYGFDPSYQGPDQDLAGRLQFQRRYYDGDCANIAADVVICRHVIEHVDRPLAMLKAIRQALAGSLRARVFFETPCVDWIIHNRVIWDFFYEHCSYFSAASLAAAFEHSGFRVVDVHHVFGGQYLWLEAQLQDRDREQLAWPSASDRVQAAQALGIAAQGLTQEWRAKIESLGAGGKVALWGAGAKGVTLANLVDPDGQLIAALIDLNPNKQGKYIPGSGHPIINYLDVVDRGIQSAILMNPNYLDENTVLLNESHLSLKLVV